MFYRQLRWLSRSKTDTRRPATVVDMNELRSCTETMRSAARGVRGQSMKRSTGTGAGQGRSREAT